MRSFSDLAPQPLWNYFSEILKVPRPSKKEERMIAWLLEFAASHGLEAKRDDAGNVLISKPAVPGREKAPVVVLQTTWTWCVKKTATRRLISTRIPSKG